MSQSFNCHCPERRKPVENRNWGVIKRWYRQSAFDGYAVRHSNYSEVMCLSCRGIGRTKAQFVNYLPDLVMEGGTGQWVFKEPYPHRSGSSSA